MVDQLFRKEEEADRDPSHSPFSPRDQKKVTFDNVRKTNISSWSSTFFLLDTEFAIFQKTDRKP